MLDKQKIDGFFSTDLGAFRCAAVGGLNPAIAQLVMARGTGPDNVGKVMVNNQDYDLGNGAVCDSVK